MTAAPGSRASLRVRLSVVDGSPWLPVAIAVVVLAATAVASVVAPASIHGDVVLATASVAIVAAYVAWPKPALLVFCLFVLLYHTLARWFSPELRHLDEVCVPILFVAALIRTRPWQRRWIEPLRDGALLVMFVAGIGSSLINGVPASVWLLALALLLKIFAFLYIVLWHDFTARDVRQLYPLVLGLGILVLALVPLELADSSTFRQVLNLSDISTAREGLPSVKSIFNFPVLFAWFAAFVGLYLTAGYVVLRKRILLIVAALFAVGTVLAGRRRAIAGVGVALIGGVVLVAAQTRSWRATVRAWWPALVGTTILIIAFLPSLLGLATVTIDSSAVPGVAAPDARVALYQTSALIARDNFPFGVGLGRYGSAVSRNPYSPVYAVYGLNTIDGLSPANSSFVTDTFWPRILGETGVIGLGALIVFSIVLAVQVWRAASAPSTDGLTRAFLLGSWMVLLQAIVETFASSLFDAPPRIYLLFGVVAVCLSLARQPAEARGWNQPSGVASMPSLRAAK